MYLSLLDFHECSYMKNEVYECKVGTTDELQQQILVLQDTLMTPRFFIRLHFLQSNQS